jgi:hypothetical protein
MVVVVVVMVVVVVVVVMEVDALLRLMDARRHWARQMWANGYGCEETLTGAHSGATCTTSHV